MSELNTHPHDYRQLFAADPRPVVVGGQAVNLWALFYFEPSELLPVSRRFGSHDLDVLSSKDVLTLLERLPDWKYEKTDWKKFGIGITARAQKVEPDGRRLLMETLPHAT